jgi:spore coat polysaccharide biosynthesis predicted glycosyltransferase SpsG
MPCADLRVLFAVAAGPRRGFGHLVRCRSLARAMGVRPLVAVRGGGRVVDIALAFGCDVIAGARPGVVARVRPDVLVVDDPIARTSAAWIAAGRRAGCLVVSVHDLGLGCLDADLVVDGSVTRTARGRRGRTLAGTSYAVLDPGLVRRRRETGRGTRVLISLGGGPRARRAAAIAAAIARVQPEARIRVVGGFLGDGAREDDPRIRWVSAPRGLREELARADVAVVGGGVSLYEACALGVPAVGVPVVPAQEPTVAGFARRRAALAVAGVNAPPEAVASHAARLINDPQLRRRVSRTARQAVDGRGASRVAAAIAAISRGRRRARPAEGRNR